jgi:hypothetical protein
MRPTRALIAFGRYLLASSSSAYECPRWPEVSKQWTGKDIGVPQASCSGCCAASMSPCLNWTWVSQVHFGASHILLWRGCLMQGDNRLAPLIRLAWSQIGAESPAAPQRRNHSPMRIDSVISASNVRSARTPLSSLPPKAEDLAWGNKGTTSGPAYSAMGASASHRAPQGSLYDVARGVMHDLVAECQAPPRYLNGSA